MGFRDRFEGALKAQKAKGATWTKSFTWKQVMKVFDGAWGAGDYYQGCEVHGGCSQCETEGLQDKIGEIDSRLDDLMTNVAELKKEIDATRGSVRSDARRGDEVGDSKAE